MKNDPHPVNCVPSQQTNPSLAESEVFPAEAAGCCRHKHRDSTEYHALLTRLKRIEGQVRGIQGMVEKEAYCIDILTQVSAVQSALNAFARELLSNHIRTCVVQDIQSGNLDTVEELVSTCQKMMK